MFVKTMIVGRHLVEKGASFIVSGRGDGVASDVTNTGCPLNSHTAVGISREHATDL